MYLKFVNALVPHTIKCRKLLNVVNVQTQKKLLKSENIVYLNTPNA